MRRILLIAKRDYLQVVMSKAYLIGLIIFPLIIGGGFLLVSVVNRGNAKPQRVAIVDHTGISAAAVIEAAEESSRQAVSGTRNPYLPAPRFTFEEVKPAPEESGQLLELCDQIRSGRLSMVLDISADALESPGASSQPAVRYYTNSAGFDTTNAWVSAAVNDGLRRVRLEQLNIDAPRVTEVLRQVPVVSMDLVKTDPATGRILLGERKSAVPPGLVSYFFALLLIVVVMAGAAPNLGVIAEDKMQRVFEMLLSSATPFELMAGKVLASLGASLTSSAFYIIGGLLVLSGMAALQLAPLGLLPWFFAYLIADVVMLAAWSAALGSACATPQDAQHLAFLLILPIIIPVFLMTPVAQQPNGAMSLVMAFIPPFTPVVMLLRQALPGGVPWWQPWVGLAGVIAFALLVVWGASRIFRVGILAQGKTPKLPELLRWVWER